MKLKSVLIRFLIFTLGVIGIFAMSSCASGCLLTLIACNSCKSCDSSSCGSGGKGIRYEENEDGTYSLSHVGYNETDVEILSVYKGKPVVSIEPYAFLSYTVGCSSEEIPVHLNRLIIPESITKIGERAFGSKFVLDELYYEGDISGWLNMDIGCSPFTGDTSFIVDGKEITSIKVPGSNESIGRNTFSGFKKLTDVTFHEKVTDIGEKAFFGCTKLKNLELPESLSVLGGKAFGYCSSIEKVVIPEKITSISSGVFEYCTSLKSVKLHNAVTEIGRSSFSGCISLTEINLGESGVVNINEYAFENCSALTSVIIPETTQVIGENAFDGCVKLVEVYNLSSLEIYAGGSGFGKVAKYAIAVHNSLDDESILNVRGDFVFIKARDEFERNYLASYIGEGDEVVLPDNFDGEDYDIKNKIFGDNSTVTSIHIPGCVKEIGNNAFDSCALLKTVTGGENVTKLGWYAFYGCSSLTIVNVSSQLKFIGMHCFDECASLKSFNLPETLEHLGDYAFSGCQSLLRAAIPAAVKTVPKGAYKGSGVIIAEIAEGITEMDESCFENCSALAEISLPESLESIGRYAFYGCSALENVVVPKSVENINERTFEKSGLKFIEIKGAGNIGSNAFSQCSALQYVICDGGLSHIGSNAFYRCASLKELNLSKELEYFNPSGFNGCNNLEKLTVENGNTVYYSVNNCIVEYSSKTLVLGCKNSEIPNDIKEIGSCAFYGRAKGNIALSDSVKIIGSSAFAYSDIKSISLRGVNELQGYAFYYCKSLQNVEFSENLTKIGEYGLYNCAVVSLDLPVSLNSIGFYALDDSLRTVNYAGTKQQWNEINKSTGWCKEITVYCKGSFPFKEDGNR